MLYLSLAASLILHGRGSDGWAIRGAVVSIDLHLGGLGGDVDEVLSLLFVSGGDLLFEGGDVAGDVGGVAVEVDGHGAHGHEGGGADK